MGVGVTEIAKSAACSSDSPGGLVVDDVRTASSKATWSALKIMPLRRPGPDVKVAIRDGHGNGS
jgi:hypothetical protein